MLIRRSPDSTCPIEARYNRPHRNRCGVAHHRQKKQTSWAGIPDFITVDNAIHFSVPEKYFGLPKQNRKTH